jgi:hypothetical protein
LSGYHQGDTNFPQNPEEIVGKAPGAAQNAAHFPPDLARIVGAWADLSDRTRQAILELIDGNVRE